MHKAIHGLVGFVALIAAMAASAVDIRLGAIEGSSAAGEPVRARIPVYEVPTEELERLEVGLAPSRVFDRAGVERAPELSWLSLELVTQGEDAPYIAVTSEQPIDKPLLDFLVQVSWPEGNLVREYTLLLDRPATAGEEAPRPQRAEALDEQPFEEITREGETQRRQTAYGPVEPGDTLWEIAREHRPDDSVTIPQTMLAILEANPHAFSDDNVNDLLSGWWLQLPSKEQIQSRSPAEAQAAYEQHLEEWVPPAKRQVKTEEAPSPSEVPGQEEPSEAPAEEEAHLQILALQDEEGSERVLSLLDADLEPSESNVRRLQGALAAVREERESLRAERQSLRERVDDLGERVAALEQLVDLRMEGLLPPPDDAAPTPRVPLPRVDEPLQPVPEPEGEEPEEEPEPVEPQPEEEDEPLDWADWLGDEDVSAADVWEEEGTQRQVLMGAGAALLAIAAVAALLVWRRRSRKARQQRPGLSLDPGELGAEAETAQAARRDPLEVADAYIADDALRDARQILERGLHREPRRADLRLRLLDVLAQLGEREAFLEQAQELYDRTRSEQDPVWQTARSIGQRFTPDAALFGGAAAGAAASADVEGEGEPVSDDEAEADAESGLDAKPDLEELDLALGTEEEEAPEPGGEGAEPAGDEAEPEDEFDQRLEAAFSEAEQAAPEAEAEPGSEPEPGSGEEAGPEPAMTGGAETSAEAQDMVDDLFGGSEEASDDEDEGEEALEEMDLDSLFSEEEADQEGASEEAPEEQAGDEGPDGAAGLDPEEEGASEADPASEEAESAPGVGEGDEADTKLDLARAYIDLGDEAGARELLEEVIEEGTDSQRENARKVLGDLTGA